MRITLKDALRSLISCENKYGWRSMMLTWGGGKGGTRVVPRCASARRKWRAKYTRGQTLLTEQWSRF